MGGGATVFCIGSSDWLLETKIAKFANSVNLNEVPQNEPPHLGMSIMFALLSLNSQYDTAWT